MRLRLLVTLLGLPFLIFVALLRIRSGVRLRKAALEVVLGMYALLVASMVFLPVFLDPAERARQALSAARFGMDWFNPVPFHTIGALVTRATSTQLTLALANLGLLVPLGVLAPAAFPRMRDWRLFVGSALGVAVTIEVVQYLQRVTGLAFRSVDVDDVILNTLGALIGFAAFTVAFRAYKRIRYATPVMSQRLSNKRIERTAKAVD